MVLPKVSLGAWLMGYLCLLSPHLSIYQWTVFMTSSKGHWAPPGCQALPLVGRISIADVGPATTEPASLSAWWPPLRT